MNDQFQFLLSMKEKCLAHAMDYLEMNEETYTPEDAVNLADKFLTWVMGGAPKTPLEAQIADAIARARRGTGEPPNNA
jgi:hypothetical protein